MHEKNIAPVVLFVYNRPDHTMRLLRSLNKTNEASQTKLFIFSDQAKNATAQEKVREVRQCISNFIEDESCFYEVEVRAAENNKGLAKSIIDGVTEIIETYGKVIVLEDDLEVSADFLDYMNDALDFYQDADDVWAISGYTFPMKALEGYCHDVYFTGRGCSWGWATWQNRWNTVDWDVGDYSKFKHNIARRHAFAEWGGDLPEMLDAYMYGEVHSWAIRWCYEAFKQNKFTVYPTRSRVKNGGTDGSGTNFHSVETRYDTQLNTCKQSCVFEHCDVDEKIRREFANKYLTPIERVKLKTRWFLIRLGLLKRK